jgi:hypothetical protein
MNDAIRADWNTRSHPLPRAGDAVPDIPNKPIKDMTPVERVRMVTPTVGLRLAAASVGQPPRPPEPDAEEWDERLRKKIAERKRRRTLVPASGPGAAARHQSALGD